MAANPDTLAPQLFKLPPFTKVDFDFHGKTFTAVYSTYTPHRSLGEKAHPVDVTLEHIEFHGHVLGENDVSGILWDTAIDVAQAAYMGDL